MDVVQQGGGKTIETGCQPRVLEIRREKRHVPGNAGHVIGPDQDGIRT